MNNSQLIFLAWVAVALATFAFPERCTDQLRSSVNNAIDDLLER